MQLPRGPFPALHRGLLRQFRWLRAWWVRTPSERRGSALVAAAAAAALAATLPPPAAALLLAAWLTGTAWSGRRPPRPGHDAAADTRLRALYDALVPCFADPRDPDPLYGHGGDWRHAFTDHRFDDGHRLLHLRLRYPAYFPDQAPAARAGVEAVLAAKAGRDREYHYCWAEQAGELLLTALPPLPADVAAQRFATAPAEIVLGVTDTLATRRTTPARTLDGHIRHIPPLIWRTGPRSTEPHLLALGRPGSGTTTLLRCLALQALHRGDLLVVDGAGGGEYAFLSGHPGLLALESGPAGSLAALEWAAHETERRLAAVGRARARGHPVPADARRPLWIVVDRPTALSQAAAAEGRPDPQALLHTPLRHGRAAGVTVAAADTLDAVAELTPALTAHTRARVALGALTPRQVHDVLGAPPATSPVPAPPPGRGYARLGTADPCRLQVPPAPDPHDEEAHPAARAAVLALLATPRIEAPAHPARPTG
ncbi:membrane protein [Streptomyces capparidis]